MKDWDEIEHGIFDIDKIMERIEADSDEPTKLVIYSRNTKKSAKRNNSRFIDSGK